MRHGKANGKPWFEIDVIAPQPAAKPWRPARSSSRRQRTRRPQILRGLNDQFPPHFRGSNTRRSRWFPRAIAASRFSSRCDGFGFLVPRSEGLRVLGTVFNSSLFAGRAPEGMACFTSFAGGATDPELCELSDEEITEIICGEVARVLGITGKPVATSLHRYARALPQYNLGHTQTIKSLKSLTRPFPDYFSPEIICPARPIGSCVEQANRTARGSARSIWRRSAWQRVGCRSDMRDDSWDRLLACPVVFLPTSHPEAEAHPTESCRSKMLRAIVLPASVSSICFVSPYLERNGKGTQFCCLRSSNPGPRANSRRTLR